MDIKKSLRFLMVFAICIASGLTVHPESATAPPPETQRTGDGILNLVSKDTARKRMPSKNFIELYYENGILTIEPYTREGEFSMLLSNDDTGYIKHVPKISFGESVVIDLDYGSYSVTAYSCTGEEFSGTMTIY